MRNEIHVLVIEEGLPSFSIAVILPNDPILLNIPRRECKEGDQVMAMLMIPQAKKSVSVIFHKRAVSYEAILECVEFAEEGGLVVGKGIAHLAGAKLKTPTNDKLSSRKFARKLCDNKPSWINIEIALNVPRRDGSKGIMRWIMKCLAFKRTCSPPNVGPERRTHVRFRFGSDLNQSPKQTLPPFKWIQVRRWRTNCKHMRSALRDAFSSSSKFPEMQDVRVSKPVQNIDMEVHVPSQSSERDVGDKDPTSPLSDDRGPFFAHDKVQLT
ncbi:hypothetical protein B0H19DRAFT_1082887 [Mycena capillaripes]|nr:hypothetical protein B0H19DRAFT_1082887 [Mycena capillaripes]